MNKSKTLKSLTQAAGALIVLLGCAGPPQRLAQEPPLGPRLYVFDCGHITTNDAGLFSDGGEYKAQHLELPVRCYLIRHPKGDLQWDSGLSDEFVRNGEAGVVIDGVRHPSAISPASACIFGAVAAT